jgi:hypothetical protein
VLSSLITFDLRLGVIILEFKLMFALYQRFIEQVKEEDLQRYNEKHRDYLVRSGKIKDTKQQKENIRGSNKAHQASNK